MFRSIHNIACWILQRMSASPFQTQFVMSSANSSGVSSLNLRRSPVITFKIIKKQFLAATSQWTTFRSWTWLRPEAAPRHMYSLLRTLLVCRCRWSLRAPSVAKSMTIISGS
uniref:Candidate secreted effector n=1 Tax=Meloidogyne incognita TaxID=6306 RepID=A0A914NPF6_MELIC